MLFPILYILGRWYLFALLIIRNAVLHKFSSLKMHFSLSLYLFTISSTAVRWYLFFSFFSYPPYLWIHRSIFFVFVRVYLRNNGSLNLKEWKLGKTCYSLNFLLHWELNHCTNVGCIFSIRAFIRRWKEHLTAKNMENMDAKVNIKWSMSMRTADFVSHIYFEYRNSN